MKTNNHFQPPGPQSQGTKHQGGESSWFTEATKPIVVTRALLMAAVVGSILVVINHGTCLYTGHFGFTCFWQSALTFFVPYSVSTISSVLAVMNRE